MFQNFFAGEGSGTYSSTTAAGEAGGADAGFAAAG
jgi:hypothetical protein